MGTTALWTSSAMPLDDFPSTYPTLSSKTFSFSPPLVVDPTKCVCHSGESILWSERMTDG